MVYPTYRSIKITDLKNISELYARVYNLPPWNETWTIDRARSVVDEDLSQEGFVGNIVEVNEQIIGFMYGYSVPRKNTACVSFELINPLLRSDYLLYGSIYGSAMAISPEYQTKGMGQTLFNKFMGDASKNGFEIFLGRTINSNMLTILERAASKKLKPLFSDPVNNIPWYGFKIIDLEPQDELDVLRDFRLGYIKCLPPHGWKSGI